jgi:hypothetical protein
LRRSDGGRFTDGFVDVLGRNIGGLVPSGGPLIRRRSVIIKISSDEVVKRDKQRRVVAVRMPSAGGKSVTS